MQKVVATSAVIATAEVMRAAILKLPDGEWLGSEDDVLDRLGVSRPTLRQAARLLEAEELLVVRRGLNGGLFTRRPTTDVVARMASVYLRAAETTVVDVTRSWFLLLEESAKLAADHPDAAMRSSLEGEVDVLLDLTSPDDRLSRFAALQVFAQHLADLSCSPTLRLFTRVLSTLVVDAPPDLRTSDGPFEFPATPVTNLRRIASAIRDGNGAAAARHVRKDGELIVAWYEEQMPNRTI
jgi:GntR family transcriptional regulator, transcriptional repressor for pyruvate dehydrogenase complex